MAGDASGCRGRWPSRLREFAAADESIAGVVQRISNAHYLGVVDVRDGAYIVDGSAWNPELVFNEGDGLLAGNGTALRLLLESHDACVPFTVERNDHIRLLGDFWRRTRTAADQ